jgi:hypothetical protein
MGKQPAGALRVTFSLDLLLFQTARSTRADPGGTNIDCIS